MDAETVQQVRARANQRCEYCHFSERFSPLSFHVEHIIAKQHRGSDELGNLALACPNCNLHKGPNLTSIDPDSGLVTVLFNPRTQVWEHHFKLEGHRIVGITPEGRTTAWLLQFNSHDRIQWRVLIGGAG